MVDALDEETDPFYGLDEDGKFLDGSAISSGKKNVGVEFYTCAVGIKNGKWTFLGCIHWAIYNDPDDKIKWVWDHPDVSLDCPVEVGDAIRRWNGIDGNKRALVSGLNYTGKPLNITEKDLERPLKRWPSGEPKY